MEPTPEQIKTFWEWCGFKPNIGIPSGKILNWWVPEDAILIGELPDIDLNNLFKYAVPKLAQNPNLTITFFEGYLLI